MTDVIRSARARAPSTRREHPPADIDVMQKEASYSAPADLPTFIAVDDEAGILDTYEAYLAPVEDGGAISSARRVTGDGARPVALCRLLVAETGEHAVELVAAEYDAGRVVQAGFFDMKMPGGIDGLETIRRIREIDPRILCVIVTAYQDRSLDDIGSIFGVDATDSWDYLNKPFTANEIVQKARNLTASWERRRRDEERARAKDAANRLLEDAVAERTKALANANQELERRHEELQRAMDEIEATNERLVEEMAQRERIETELRLAQKLEAVGQLAAGIAHEINTPIQYIGDNTEFLRSAFEGYHEFIDRLSDVTDAVRGLATTHELVEAVDRTRNEADIEFLDDEVPRAIEHTLDGVKRVSTIVRAMKDFSHPGSDQKTLVDVNKAIESSAAVSRNEWKYVADLELDLDDAVPMVPALGAELNQVFLNLIVNAAHAIEAKVGAEGEKGVIEISTTADDAWVIVDVHDSGTGISPDLVERIFEPFFTTKGVGKGTGQGLAIAHSVVADRHGGRIDVTSRPGEGSTFTIKLPRGEPGASTPAGNRAPVGE